MNKSPILNKNKIKIKKSSYFAANGGHGWLSFDGEQFVPLQKKETFETFADKHAEWDDEKSGTGTMLSGWVQVSDHCGKESKVVRAHIGKGMEAPKAIKFLMAVVKKWSYAWEKEDGSTYEFELSEAPLDGKTASNSKTEAHLSPERPITAALTVAFFANYPADKHKYPAPLIAIRRCAAKASGITVLSAFYTPKFLLGLLETVPRGQARERCEVHVVLNGLRGVARSEQMKELKDARDKLKKMGFRSPDIRVNDAKRLFHTKLYQFRNGNQFSWFVGSANASEFAFDSDPPNDEILVMCRGRHPHVSRYVEDILENSVSIDKASEPRPSSLVHLFKTGVLYFKSSLRPQFLFDRIGVPPALKATGERPPYTDPKEPFGPFNVRRCLESLEGSSSQTGDDEPTERTRAALTPYSVETCFGLWVPSAYVGKVNERIDKRSILVERDLEMIAGKLADRRTSVKQAFSATYLAFFRANNVPIREKKMEASFERFLGKLVTKLADAKYRKRCAHPFLQVFVPEIWADPVASREFSDTFAEYVAFRLSQTGNKPRVIEKLQQAAALESHDSASDIQRKLERWIRRLRSSDAFQEAFAK